MFFHLHLENIRPIKQLSFRLDLNRNAPLCIVGQNGSGKTTLAKTIMNFALADTFHRTMSDGALQKDSIVRYVLGDSSHEFTYDPAIRTLSTRKPVPEYLRSLVAVELPIPHGQRFSYFHTLADADTEIRRAIILEEYEQPSALVEFLTGIYGESRFGQLLEVKFARGKCCFFLAEDGRYIREDSFSSGEFFLVNLYRRLQSGSRLIFIDEIDISLDAAAQARLVDVLRSLCTQFSVNVVFTSHSLALMQTLQKGELLHLDRINGQSTLEERSFAFVKSVLFGFKGWDRYILVEDEVASKVIEHHIKKYCTAVHYKYIIIKAGGFGQVLSLLARNREHSIFGPPDSVIAILDGDQKNNANARQGGAHCMPLWSLETEIEKAYDHGGSITQLPLSTYSSLPAQGRAKALYKACLRLGCLTPESAIELACKPHAAKLQEFADQILSPFLCSPPHLGDVTVVYSENDSLDSDSSPD